MTERASLPPIPTTSMPYQFRKSPHVRVVALGALVTVMSGCSRDVTSPSQVALRPAGLRAATPPTPIGSVTRAIAVALKDSSARASALRAMRASKFREGKLQLNRYLRGQAGRSLLEAASRATGRPQSAVLATLDSLPSLEFYMPVAAHRAAWDGGEKLLVAGALDDSSIVAYDLDGNTVNLSITSPPSTPVLAVVPVETNFGDVRYDGIPAATATILPPCGPEDPPDCDWNPGGGGGMPAQPPGIYMDKMVIRDAHEPWLRG